MIKNTLARLLNLMSKGVIYGELVAANGGGVVLTNYWNTAL